VTDVARWEEYGRAHGEVFGDHPAAPTMVVGGLVHSDVLVEIEADAWNPRGGGRNKSPGAAFAR